MRTIGERAFTDCSFSGGLTIPEGVTEIAEGAFCSSSKYSGSPAHGKITGTLTLPSTLKTIGAYAFAYEGFSGELLIPDGVTCIGANAFAECDGFGGTLSLPDSVKTVGEWAFYQCEGFTGLKLPAGLTKIEKLSFAFMAGLKTEVAIPEGVTEIGEGAFEWSYMPSVRLPSTLKKIEKQAFMHAHNLTKITLPDGLKKGVLWIFLLWKRYARRVFPRRSAPDCRDAERQLLVPVGLDALLPARHVRLDGRYLCWLQDCPVGRRNALGQPAYE